MKKQLYFLLIAAILLPASSFAGCKLQQEIINKGNFKVKSTLQGGNSVTAGNAVEINSDICSRISQRIVNKGSFTVQSTLQGGRSYTAGNFARIGGSN